MAEKDKIREIYIVRALAILGVLAVHGTSFATVELDHDSMLYTVYLIFNRMGKLGTPTFIFLSSLVLFYNYTRRDLSLSLIRRFYSRRLTYIVVPYLFWSLFYFFLLLFYSGYLQGVNPFSLFSWPDLRYDLLWGKAYTHLYFVIINIQFYVVFPLFLLLYHKQNRWTKYLFVCGWILQWCFYYMHREWFETWSKGSLFPSYLSYFGLGAVAGTYYQSFKAWVLRRRNAWLSWAVWLAAGSLNVWLYYQGNVYKRWFNNFWYESSWNVYTVASCLTLFHAAYLLYRMKNRWLSNVLIRLGDVSFGIYLIHPLVLFFWRRLPFGNQILVYHSTVLGGIALTLALSWFAVRLMSKLPSLYWMVFGQLPTLQKRRGREAPDSPAGAGRTGRGPAPSEHA